MQWFALLGVALVLSGCAVKEGDPTTMSGAPTVSTGKTTTGTAEAGNSTGNPAGNGTVVQRAPTANLTASVGEGTAPLNVTFSLTGSDADGDALNWTLAFGDGNETAGTGLPADVQHRFTLGGNFTVTLRVTDGHGNATASVLVRVTALPGGPKICTVEPDETVGPFYYTTAEGGNWVFMESNGIAGLQVGNSHPTGPDGGGIGAAFDGWAHCVDPDQMIF